MRRFAALVVLAALPFAATVALRAAADIPAWAYAIAPPPTPAAPGTPAPAPDTSLKSLPGAAKQYTRQQIADGFGPTDWYPEDHPGMAAVVALRKRPDARAGDHCHMPHGKG